MGFGWPSGVRPKSMTSRSNQFATGYFAAIEGNDGSLGSTGATTWRNDRRFRNDHTWCTRKRPLAARSSLAKSDRSRPLRRSVMRSAKSGNEAGRLEQKLAGPGFAHGHPSVPTPLTRRLR